MVPENSLETGKKPGLLARGPEGTLSREHHWGTAGTEPSIIDGTFVADDATDGHEESG